MTTPDPLGDFAYPVSYVMSLPDTVNFRRFDVLTGAHTGRDRFPIPVGVFTVLVTWRGAARIRLVSSNGKWFDMAPAGAYGNIPPYTLANETAGADLGFQASRPATADLGLRLGVVLIPIPID